MVELIPKKQKVKLPRGVEILFFISVGTFVLVLVVFGILTLLVRGAEDDLRKARAAIERERSPERLRMEAELKENAEKIDVFSKLLPSHYDTRKFFGELERTVHPQVWFSEIVIDFEKFTVTLSGFAESFYAVGQQIAIFEQQQFFQNVNLSDIGFSREGEVQFTLNFSFDKKLFSQQ